MKKILLLLCFGLICGTNSLLAQKKTTTTATPQPEKQTQKKPPPYVYKTDYDVKMKEVDAKVNSAVGTAQTLKRELSGKLDKVNELDAKMQEVEEILNSANFKIGLTNDSLAKTRFSIDEFKADTDKKTDTLFAEAEMHKNLIWGAMALAVLLFIILFIMMNSRLQKLKKAMHLQTEQQTDLLNERLEEQRKNITDELTQFKNRMQDDTLRMRTEIRSGNDKTTAQLASIMEKLDALDNADKTE